MVPSAFSVEDKVTIITGGGSGIGEYIARRFAEAGAPVILASRKLENLERVRDEIVKDGGKAIALACDVRKEEDVQRVVDTAVKEFGRLDVLVNNHGASFRCNILDMSPNGFSTAHPEATRDSIMRNSSSLLRRAYLIMLIFILKV